MVSSALWLLAVLFTIGLPASALPQSETASQTEKPAPANTLASVSEQPRTLNIQIKSQSPIETHVLDIGGPLQHYLNINNPGLMGCMHDIIMPFGATAVLPLARGRLEIHGGIGGLFVPYESPYSKPNTWLTQTSLGARVALDPSRHLWLGATSYYLTDFGQKTRQWGTSAADLTIRFGR